MAHLLLAVLEENRAKKRLLLHEFVLMPNHFHLLIMPSFETPLEKAIQFIKGGFSYRAKKELNFLWQIWERSFSEHRVKDAADYERCRGPADRQQGELHLYDSLRHDQGHALTLGWSRACPERSRMGRSGLHLQAIQRPGFSPCAGNTGL